MNKDAPYVVSGIVRRLFFGLFYSFYDHARLLSILLIMNHLPQITSPETGHPPVNPSDSLTL